MDWLFTVLGVVTVAVGVNDVFRTFVHPQAKARLSTVIVKIPWRISRRLTGSPARASGPVGVLLVMVTWVLLQVVGWALVYLPHAESGFSYSDQVSPHQYPAFAESLYVSLVVLGTLGLGDVVMTQPVLRLVSPVQALIGFLLLTAAISWLSQLFPAVARRRAWALRVSHLKAAGVDDGLTESHDGPLPALLLHEIAAGAVRVTVDLRQNAETYYFADREGATCFPTAMEACARWSDVARRSGDVATATGGAALHHAVAELAGHLHERFVPRARGDVRDIIRAAHEERCSTITRTS